MAVTFNNVTFNQGQSTTGIFLVDTFTGANTLSGTAPVTINGTIDAPGSQASVSLNIAGVVTANATGTYLGFSDAGGGDFVYYFSVTAATIPTPVTIGVTGAAVLPNLQVTTPVNTTVITAPAGPAIPCYAAGTLIRTARGEVAVEDLAVGDRIVTASGGERPVTWLGHRTVDCASHPTPVTVQPIRIRAGAVAPGMPARDLRVSPDHALFFDDVLVQARFLLNGSTIVRDEAESVTYWHVELDAHDVLIAENLPAESYLDVGNRRAFLEAGDVIALRPDFAGGEQGGHCAPLVTAGERLRAIRAWLAERARHLGTRTTPDSALRLVADGIALTPVAVEQGRFRYQVPAGTEALRLVSRSGVPAELAIESADVRRLGVCLTALEVDGETIVLDDPRLTDGWHDAEAGLRWTDGDAGLPLGRTITLAAHGLEAYPAPAPRLAPSLAPAGRRLAMAG